MALGKNTSLAKAQTYIKKTTKKDMEDIAKETHTHMTEHYRCAIEMYVDSYKKAKEIMNKK